MQKTSITHFIYLMIATNVTDWSEWKRKKYFEI